MTIIPYKGGRYQADVGFFKGKRLRKVFNLKKDAQAWLDELRKYKLHIALGIPKLCPIQLIDAEEAIGILGDLGTLREAALQYRQTCEARNSAMLCPSVKTFLDHLKLRDSRPRYLEGMRNTLELFEKEAGNLPLGTYTPEKILDWLRRPEWSKTTFANRRREISVFFNWALKQGLIKLNPVARIPSPKIDRDTIDVLTPLEAKKLLAGTMDRQRIYFAIALFAGLRPGEIDRLQWQDVKLGRGIIDVSVDTSKIGERRPVKIEPNLRKFLEATQGYSTDDFILRADKSDMMKLAFNAIGRESWPQNICRHSFGSYHLEMFGDMNATAIEMGHKSTAMLFRCYRAVVDHVDAEAFWSIEPQGLTPGIAQHSDKILDFPSLLALAE